MRLQTVMQTKGVIQSKRNQALNKARQICDARQSTEKRYSFPVDKLLEKQIINDRQYKAALYYKYLFDRSYNKKSNSWTIYRSDKFDSKHSFYNKSNRYEIQYESLCRNLFRFSKKSGSIVQALVLYDQPIHPKDYKSLIEGLDILASS